MTDFLGRDEFCKFYPSYVPPSEALRGKRIGVLDLPAGETHRQVNMRILEFPDYVGGNLMKIPIIAGQRPGFEPGGDILSFFLRQQQEVLGYQMYELRLSSESRKRLGYCLKDLGLPVALAVHLALNKKDEDLGTFPKVKNGSVILSIEGIPGAGKSLLTALLAHKNGEEIFSLDVFSEIGTRAYLEAFSKAGLGKNCKVEEALATVSELRTSCTARRINPTPSSTAELFNQILEFYKRPDRPEILVMEGVYAPLGGRKLELNILHLVSIHSFESVLWIFPPNEYEEWGRYFPGLEKRDTLQWFENPDLPQLRFLIKPNGDSELADRMPLAGDFEFALESFSRLRPEILEKARSLHTSFSKRVDRL